MPMGADSTRFRARAVQCRSLAKTARDSPSRQALSEIADELDAEAVQIEAEERRAAIRSDLRR